MSDKQTYFIAFLTGKATDCYDIFNNGIGTKTGVYNVTLWRSNTTIEVYCDIDTAPSGWTVKITIVSIYYILVYTEFILLRLC